MNRALGVAIILISLVTVSGAVQASTASVVVAVDTSRSVTASDLALIRRLLDPTLAGGSAVGLVEFNDEARWVVPAEGGPEAVRTALERLAPAGRSTVLRDALVIAGRGLAGGGVILLATDGRDEGSVATVEDVVRVLNGRSIAVIAIGTGRTLDERAMRRIALLTGGRYLGRASVIAADGVRAAVDAALNAVAVAAAEPAPQRAVLTPPAASPTPTPAAPPAGARFLPLFIGGFLAALIAAAAVWLLLRRRHAGRTCPDCGHPLADWETTCANCEMERMRLHEAERDRPVAPPAEPVADDARQFEPAVFEKVPLAERLDKTFSLDEQAVLVVRQPRRPARTFALEHERVIAVGRAASVNTIAVDDPTVSAQHFKIVPRGDDLFVIDLESTNGTLVNGRRVRVHRLSPGDVILTGQVEFEYRTQLVRHN